MAWDDKLLSDINALRKAKTDPSSQKPDQSSIEAAIQASIQGKKPAAPAAPAKPATPPAKPATPPAKPVAPPPKPAQPVQPPKPATPPPEKKPMDMSAIEAAILASIQGGKKPDAAPEPVVTVEPAPQPAPEPEEPVRPNEIVLEPIPDEEPETPAVPGQVFKVFLRGCLRQ